VTLATDSLEMVLLTGGGHVASLSLPGGPNVLWQSEWKTIEPQQFRPGRDSSAYGDPPVGNFLSHFTGHAVCADYFGAPSREEAAQGLPLHGEIGSRPWQISVRNQAGLARARCRADAPKSEFRFEREVTLRGDESVACFRERLTNQRPRDRSVQWVQHATFGKPLLVAGESTVCLPATEGITWPHGYEGKALLADSRRFAWPMAPMANGGVADLSQPFARSNKGFVAAALVERGRDYGFVAVLNWNLGLLAGYCFRRADFPWIAIWEENRARRDAPWNGRSQARGLEFGTTATPLGLRDTILNGPVLGETTFIVVPANATKEICYLAFVTRVGRDWRTVRDVEVAGERIVIRADRSGQRVLLPARGLAMLGW